MPIRFKCPDCQTELSSDSDKSGTQIGCPQCQLPIIVPDPIRKPQLGILLGDDRPDPPLVERDWNTEPPPVKLPKSMPQPGTAEKNSGATPPANFGRVEPVSIDDRQHEESKFGYGGQTDDDTQRSDLEYDLDDCRPTTDRGRASYPLPTRGIVARNRILIAGGLTTASILLIVIGLLPSNQYTRQGIAILVIGMCLAFAALGVLFLSRPSRGRR